MHMKQSALHYIQEVHFMFFREPDLLFYSIIPGLKVVVSPDWLYKSTLASTLRSVYSFGKPRLTQDWIENQLYICRLM